MDFLNHFFLSIGEVFSPIDYSQVDWDIGSVDEGKSIYYIFKFYFIFKYFCEK